MVSEIPRNKSALSEDVYALLWGHDIVTYHVQAIYRGYSYRALFFNRAIYSYRELFKMIFDV